MSALIHVNRLPVEPLPVETVAPAHCKTLPEDAARFKRGDKKPRVVVFHFGEPHSSSALCKKKKTLLESLRSHVCYMF